MGSSEVVGKKTSTVNIYNFVNADMTFRVDGSTNRITNDSSFSIVGNSIVGNSISSNSLVPGGARFEFTYPTQPTTFSYILDASHVYDSSFNGLSNTQDYEFIVFATIQPRSTVSKTNIDPLPPMNQTTNSDILNNSSSLYLAIFIPNNHSEAAYKIFFSSTQSDKDAGVSDTIFSNDIYTADIVVLLPLILKP
jgi:hypothetical protein